jgi:hypothetical protein
MIKKLIRRKPKIYIQVRKGHKVTQKMAEDWFRVQKYKD